MSKSGWLTGHYPEPFYLPFPSFGLNRALGGQGLASGRIHVYWGVKASGKTTLALQQVAYAQSLGKTCAYIDAERAMDDAWAMKNGVNLDTLLRKRENSAEKILEDLLPDLDAGKIDIVVVDSLSSINFDAYFDMNDPTKNAMGSYARSSKMFTHKVLSHLGHDQHVILISHAAMDLSGQRPMLRAAVGNAIDHWASTVIKVSKSYDKKRIEEGGEYCVPVDWCIDKSKQSVYPVKGRYNFNPNSAEIDQLGELANYGVEEGFIDKNGAWFTYMEEKVQGYKGVRKLLGERPEYQEKLKQQLSETKVLAEVEEDEL